MTSLPRPDQILQAAPLHPFETVFAAALTSAIVTVAATPPDSPADLLAELECAVTTIALSALRRRA